MTKERWKYLISAKSEIDKAGLTPEEITEGWHFCADMDGLLANSNDPEGDCFCDLNKHRKQ